MNVADYIVSVLRARGVRHVFGSPGAVIEPLLAAIERADDIDWVLMRHAGSAALAASAAAKLDGGLGVCAAPSGPAAGQLLTGSLDAHLDGAPVLVLTGMVPSWKQKRSGFQDLDHARLFSPQLRSSLTVAQSGQVPDLLRDAIGYAQQFRDVAHLAIPLDVQDADVPTGAGQFVVGEAPEPLTLHAPPATAYDVVASSLELLQNPLIVVGARARGAGAEIEELAIKLKAPIISTLDAKGVIDDTHSCALGVLGIFGDSGARMTRQILADAGVILAFGVDNVSAFVADEAGTLGRELYQFEPDFGGITHRVRRARTLVGPLPEVAAGLARRVDRRSGGALIGTARKLRQAVDQQVADIETETGYVHPVAALQALGKRLSADDVIALDVGDNAVWAARYLTLAGRQATLVSSQFGATGFCLPAAIAAALGRPGSRIVGVCGDGGLQLVMGELLTAVQNGLNIVLLVFNNGRLQRVTAQAHELAGTALSNPDFVALARACGCEAAAAGDEAQLEAALEAAFDHDAGPFLIDCRIPPDCKAPAGDWHSDFAPLNFI